MGLNLLIIIVVLLMLQASSLTITCPTGSTLCQAGKNGYGGCYNSFSQKCSNGGICSTSQSIC